MKVERRVAILFQRAPLPIHSGADLRVVEMLDLLASKYDFVALFLLNYPTPQTRAFCRKRNITIRFIFPRNGIYSWLTFIKHFLDAHFQNLPWLNPIRLLRKLGIKLFYPRPKQKKINDPFWSLCDDLVALKVAECVHKDQIDVIIVEYIWLTGCVRHLPSGVTKLIDTIDVVHLRQRSFAEQGQNEEEFGLVDEKKECAALAQFDGIIAIQSKEKEIFRQMMPDKRVITVPCGGNALFLDQYGPKPILGGDVIARKLVSKCNGMRFLFLGGAHIGNLIALRHLVEHVWPRIQESSVAEHVSLIVAGDVCKSSCLNNRKLSRVISLGYVDRTDWLYDLVDVVVNPTFSGSGLKIKTVDALARGKLVITTPIGIEGILPPVDKCCLIAHTPDQFYELTLGILMGQIDTSSIMENLTNYVENNFTPDVQFCELLEYIDGVTIL